MAVTKQIPPAEWETYFDAFTRRHLQSHGDANQADVNNLALVEVLSATLGVEAEVTFVPVVGMTYDPRSDAFELALEGLDHMVFLPTEIWVIEEGNGFISALEVVAADGTREIINLRQSAAPPLRYEMPSLPEV